MVDACASMPKGTAQSYAPPAWAVEAAASAPRISPADAAPLVAIFRDARAACSTATARFRERETAIDVPRPTGCPCGCAGDASCTRHRPVGPPVDYRAQYGYEADPFADLDEEDIALARAIMTVQDASPAPRVNVLDPFGRTA